MTKIFMQMKRFILVTLFPFLTLLGLSAFLYLEYTKLSKKIVKLHSLQLANEELKDRVKKHIKQVELREKQLDKKIYRYTQYIYKRKFNKLGILSQDLLKNRQQAAQIFNVLAQMETVLGNSLLDSQTQEKLSSHIKEIKSALTNLLKEKQKLNAYLGLKNNNTNLEKVYLNRTTLYILVVLSLVSFVFLMLFVNTAWKRFKVEQNILDTALTGIKEGGSPRILAKLSRMEFLETLRQSIYDAFTIYTTRSDNTAEILSTITEHFTIIKNTEKDSKFLKKLRIEELGQLGHLFYLSNSYYFVDRTPEYSFIFRLDNKLCNAYTETLLELIEYSKNIKFKDNRLTEVLLECKKGQKRLAVLNGKLLSYKRYAKRAFLRYKKLKDELRLAKSHIENFTIDTNAKKEKIKLIVDIVHDSLAKFSTLSEKVNRVLFSIENLELFDDLYKDNTKRSQLIIDKVEKLRSMLKDLDNKELAQNMDLQLEGISLTSTDILSLNQLVLDLLTKFDTLKGADALIQDILRSFAELIKGEE